MTQEEIIEGNKLIAEFMGGRYISVDQCIATGTMHSYETKYTPIYDLKYYTSWDWLMPVVEKIVKKYDLNIQFMDGDCNVYVNKQTVNQDEIFSIGGYDDAKEAVWDAVVRFIKWYNKNK